MQAAPPTLHPGKNKEQIKGEGARDSLRSFLFLDHGLGFLSWHVAADLVSVLQLSGVTMLTGQCC